MQLIYKKGFGDYIKDRDAIIWRKLFVLNFALKAPLRFSLGLHLLYQILGCLGFKILGKFQELWRCLPGQPRLHQAQHWSVSQAAWRFLNPERRP